MSNRPFEEFEEKKSYRVTIEEVSSGDVIYEDETNCLLLSAGAINENGQVSAKLFIRNSDDHLENIGMFFTIQKVLDDLKTTSPNFAKALIKSKKYAKEVKRIYLDKQNEEH